MKFCPAILYDNQSTNITIFIYMHKQGVVQLRWLVAGILPWRPRFDTGPSMWGRFFFKYVSFLLSVSLHQCSLLIHLLPALHILATACDVKKPAYQSTRTYTNTLQSLIIGLTLRMFFVIQNLFGLHANAHYFYCLRGACWTHTSLYTINRTKEISCIERS
jgi:hypothetical protein